MNWRRPESTAEAYALEALRVRGVVVRRMVPGGWEYAPAAEFEARAAEVERDLRALRAEQQSARGLASAIAKLLGPEEIAKQEAMDARLGR